MAKLTDDERSERQRAFAKSMRLDMSEPERMLWKAIRRKIALGSSHFRRQVPIGPFIVDFCNFSCRLVIEVDGGQHFTEIAERYDARRTRFIEKRGFRVLRFTSLAVRAEIDSVIDTIIAAIDSSPTPYPSPQGGGERPALPPEKGTNGAAANPPHRSRLLPVSESNCASRVDPTCVGEGRRVAPGWGSPSIENRTHNQHETTEQT